MHLPRSAIMASDITAPSKTREKVTLKPGFHLSNWIQKLDSYPRPTVPLRKISMEEVRLHNKESDCWTVLNGKVFDITEYLQYHPGGVRKAMLGAGTDCTALFNKYHAWVNIGAMIGKCCVGVLGEENETLMECEEEEEEDPELARERAIQLLAEDEK